MKSVKIIESVLVQKTENGVTVFNMDSDILYSLEGDVALLINYLYENSGQKLVSSLEIKNYLLVNSETFPKNPNQDKSIDEAIEYLTQIKII